MGCNYYWREVTAKACVHCDRDAEYTFLHIGKASAGWTFSFRAHPDRGLVTWAAWRELLKSDRGQIVDEYDHVSSFADFENRVMIRKQQKDFRTHAIAHPSGCFLDPEGHGFSNYEFS